jgi:hypothetical protein
MIRKLFLFAVFFGIATGSGFSQSFVKTADLFKRADNDSHTGQLNITQNQAIDSLVYRYILLSKKIYKEKNYYGMEGCRIQIYRSSNRNAREESNKARAKFMEKFPDIVTYQIFADPGYFAIRAGDFRNKAEALKLFLTVSKEFPDSYIVPDIINFPDQIKK